MENSGNPLEVYRMRDTGYRKQPHYCFFRSKEEALAIAKRELQSRDDGHLCELTPATEEETREYLASLPVERPRNG